MCVGIRMPRALFCLVDRLIHYLLRMLDCLRVTLLHHALEMDLRIVCDVLCVSLYIRLSNMAAIMF